MVLVLFLEALIFKIVSNVHVPTLYFIVQHNARQYNIYRYSISIIVYCYVIIVTV